MFALIKPMDIIGKVNCKYDALTCSASELKNFMLIIFPCIGSALLPANYYAHFMLIVNAISLLSQESIPRPDLEKANYLIQQFDSQVAELYSPAMESYNMHQCLHLVQDTANFGPLWTHSAFVFESMNHELLKMCHGTTKLMEQIAWAVRVQGTLSKFNTELNVDDSAEYVS